MSHWRYEIQREQVRFEKPYYSLMVAPPSMHNGYLVGTEASRAIFPVVNDSDGTKSSVSRVIRRHQRYILRMRKQGEL